MCVIGLCLAPLTIYANVITVTNTNDSGPGSLRQALADVNDHDTINFAVTGTIGLTSTELVVDNNITIRGPGPDLLTISAVGLQRVSVFHIMPGHSVRIQGLTVTEGYTGIYNDSATLTVSNCSVSYNHGSSGGGIYNGDATLRILNSTIANNCACQHGGGYGGGIYNSLGGSVTISNSIVSGNSAITPSPEEGYGGGIWGGGLTITDSTITNNFASLTGGGIDGGGTITNSTISGNGAGGGNDHRPGQGGGIFGGGTITNCTISGNGVFGSQFKGPGAGGGIYVGGTTSISNSTLSDNSVSYGNGGDICNGGILEIRNTVLNTGNPDNIFNLSGTITSRGYNLSSDSAGGFLTGPGDQTNTNPLLGPLRDNGGPTFTHALLSGSPAIDAGDPVFTPPPAFDQRGAPFVRVFNGRIDIGSFELQPPPTPTPTPRPTPPPRPRPTPAPRP